jgi:hypothetical protein
MFYTAKDNTLPFTNLERQENSCQKNLYHMKNMSEMVIVNVIVFYFTLQRSMIGNKTFGYRTGHKYNILKFLLHKNKFVTLQAKVLRYYTKMEKTVGIKSLIK